MLVDTTHRSKDVEIMDDFDMDGEMLISSLDYLALINKWLGGNKLTINGLKSILKGQRKDRSIRIVDLGCGNGDMLRKVAAFGRKNGYSFELLGIDANQATIDYAARLSTRFPEIAYSKEDVLSPEFERHTYDIALCTLFLHHFDDEAALGLIETLLKQGSVGVVVNDLHRHRLAYYLFKLLSSVVGNSMTKEDGLVSILRGFKRADLQRFSEKLNYTTTISWRWAFRYQWIIKKA